MAVLFGGQCLRPQECRAQLALGALAGDAIAGLIEKVGADVLKDLGGDVLGSLLNAGSDIAMIEAIKNALEAYSDNFDGYKTNMLSEYNIVAPSVTESYYLNTIAEQYIAIAKDCRRVVDYVSGLDDACFNSDIVDIIGNMMAAMNEVRKEIDFVKRTVLTPGNYTSFERISMLTSSADNVTEFRKNFYGILQGAVNGGPLDPKLVSITTDAAELASYMGF